MYALAINGSPRTKGNTRILLDTVVEQLDGAGWETEVYQLGGKAIHGCTACQGCFENQDKRCVITSDCMNEVLEKMIRADAIIIGSPTYFADVTTEVKALIDRAGFVAIANDRLFKGKIGVAVAAVRRAGAVRVFDSINHLYQINGMVVPGSLYWNLGIGLEKGEVEDDEEGLENMINLGKTIALLGKAIAPLRNEWPS